MAVWGTTPCSRPFLCHTPPLARSTVLSMATARPQVAQCIRATCWRPKTANLCRQGVGHRLQTSLPRPPCRIATLFGQQGPQGLHLRRRLLQHGQQFVYLVQVTDDHDEQGLQEQAVWVDLRSAPSLFRGRGASGCDQVTRSGSCAIIEVASVSGCLTNLYGTAVAVLKSVSTAYDL